MLVQEMGDRYRSVAVDGVYELGWDGRAKGCGEWEREGHEWGKAVGGGCCVSGRPRLTWLLHACWMRPLVYDWDCVVELLYERGGPGLDSLTCVDLFARLHTIVFL